MKAEIAPDRPVTGGLARELEHSGNGNNRQIGKTEAKVHEVNAALAPVLASMRELPGCQDVRTGYDRAAGTSIAVSTFDTLEHARVSRESLGESIRRIQAAGWQGQAPEFFQVGE